MWYLILAAILLAGLAAFMQLHYAWMFTWYLSQPLSLHIDVKSKLHHFNSSHHFEAEGTSAKKPCSGEPERGMSRLPGLFLISHFLKQLKCRSWSGEAG